MSDLFGVYKLVAVAGSDAPPIDARFITLRQAQEYRKMLEEDRNLLFKYDVEDCGNDLPEFPWLVSEQGIIEPLFEREQENERIDTVLTYDHRIIAVNPDDTIWQDGEVQFVKTWDGVAIHDSDIAYYVGEEHSITVEALGEAWGWDAQVPVLIDSFYDMSTFEADAMNIIESFFEEELPSVDELDETIAELIEKAGCETCNDTDCIAWGIVHSDEG